MPEIIQRSFTSGEISPSLQSRADIVKYATGLNLCENFFVRAQGGVYSRPGLRFIGEIDDPSTQSRVGVEQFIAQGLITLNLRESDGGLDRDLLIWKMRLTSHSMKKHPYIIGDKGIQVKTTTAKRKTN